MLLHDSPLNAASIEQVIALFQARGYRLITLAEALEDPVYAIPETKVTAFGPMWGYRWSWEKNAKADGRKEPDPPGWVEKYAKEGAPTR